MLTCARLSPHAPRPHRRRAFTLVEILLVLVLGAIVLGLIAAIGTRLQHRLGAQAARAAANEQLGAAAELLPLDLRGVSPASGDVAEVSDTSIQIRATIGGAVLCGCSGNTATVALYLGAGGRQVAPSLQAGDTLWLLDAADSSDHWRPVRLDGWRRASGTCAPLTDATASLLFDLAHLWAADLRDTIGATAATLVRITRPLRLSLYRAGDGRWYLGLRSWNTLAGQFNGIQPLSGPYASPTGAGGARFTYYDAGGAALSGGSMDVRAIARVEALVISETPAPGTNGFVDSQRVVVALRNR
jgi:prepilin-type N-terminal cleavage/methylation domain-containing protein